MTKLFGLLSLIMLLFFPTPTFAHEAYVLTPQQFQDGLKVFTPNPLGALFSPAHLLTFLLISVLVGAAYLLTLVWSMTSYSAYLDKLIRKLRVIGPFIIRIAASLSFILAALSNCIFGPELTLNNLAFGSIVQIVELAVGIMILSGFLVELAGLMALGIFVYAYINYGWYLVTYANYFGEILVLILFGSRVFSIDRLLFGKKLFIQFFERFRAWETPIVRILYGLALIYAGYTIKFLHENLTILVYNEYHLRSFFNSDASFISAGAGLAETMIGLFILIGFMQRLTVIISLIFITLSLMYFRELVWPHFLLYGISLSLIINSADFLTIDHYLVPWVRVHIFHRKLLR